MADEIWGINFKMVNNTELQLEISGGENGSFQIEPNSTIEWTEIVKTISLSTVFKDENENSIMSGSLVYNSVDGVVADRGDLTNQTYSMNVYVNGENEFDETQTSNGSINVCTWDDIINGGNITLSFDEIV